MRFDPVGAMLRSLRLGDREVVRAVYSAVRDRNWGTVAPRVANLRVDREADRFRVAFDAEAVEGPIDFWWHGTIIGTREGSVRFEMDGVARSTFERNRIGFCVLHPVRECAGEPCLVETTEGTRYCGRFPRFVAPHQPFVDLRALTHEVAPGVAAEVRFEGDVFEMEDQRNWTDASFKTYCTPLALPFPVQVSRGTRVRQVVALTLHGSPTEDPTPGDPAESPVEVVVSERRHSALPRIGLGMASMGQGPEPRALERLCAARPAHLRLDMDLARGEAIPRLEEATRLARLVGADLEIALHVRDVEAELTALRSVLHRTRPPVARWLVFPVGQPSASPEWLSRVRRLLSDYDPGVPIGGGTDAYFAELNRARPPADAVDLVCYSLNPQVHAFDDESLVETLEAQGATVESAGEFAPGVPVAVTPITLKPRFNPNATGPEPSPSPGRLPAQVDARQPTLFAAAWTLASVAQLARAGAASLTFYETIGWRGIMEAKDGSPRPDLFPSVPGTVFPVYHVLADLGEMRDAQVLPVHSVRPLEVDGLALVQERRARVLLANLSSSPRTIRLAHPWATAQASVRLLDAESAGPAGAHPESFRAGGISHAPVGEPVCLALGPHATVCIDFDVVADVRSPSPEGEAHPPILTS